MRPNIDWMNRLSIAVMLNLGQALKLCTNREFSWQLIGVQCVNSSLILKFVTTGMSAKTLRHITVDEQNYLTLKRLGSAGDSFNDVISGLLKSTRRKQKEVMLNE
jgi:hypothetical protein